MKTKQLFMRTIAAFGLFNSLQAVAVSCGDVIMTDTVLTADLHCSSGYYALKVGADAVTLDLNGYSLSGTRDLVGLTVDERNKVHIKGNGGVIKGFWAGINTTNSNELKVDDIAFYDLDTGVVISSGSDGLIINNDFIFINGQGVFIANFVTGNQANSNTIKNNEFYQSATGIEICGNDSDFNSIDSNLIWLSRDHGIRLIRSDHNTLTNNEIIETTESAIQLDNAARNQIKSNSLRVGQVGLEILTNPSSGCLISGTHTSFKNVYQSNHTFEFQTAVILGSGLSVNDVFGNLINYNKLYDNNTGIFFNTDAFSNNARNNAYTGTVTPITDLGTSNSY